MANQESRFLALLRGINVGGKNLIPKTELSQCFEDLGFTNVRTYIQSGNVLFRARETSVSKLTSMIEEALSDRFSYRAQAVTLAHARYRAAVRAAHEEWGNNDQQKHNALFTLRSTTPLKVLKQMPPPKTEIETVTTGPGVIFWSVSKKHLTKTVMMRLAASKVYQQMTVRNHNTVFRLLELFDET